MADLVTTPANDSTLLAPRPYQDECLAEFGKAFGSGVKRAAAVLATGLGKTVIFAHMAARWISDDQLFGRVVILVHRDELVQQALAKLRTVAPHIIVGVIKAGQNDVHADVIVASVQTLRNVKRMDQLLDAGPVGLVIVDECFPAGTLVGGRPIETLQPGDLVPSWNEETGREEMRPIIRVMRKRPAAMVRVTFEDGATLECTPNHPLLTDQGWCPAGRLWRGASLVSFTHDANAESGPDHVHRVRGASHPDHEEQEGSLPPLGSGVLLRRASRHVGEPDQLGAHGSDEPRARVAANAGAQPHAQPRDPREDDRDASQDRPQAPRAGRERQADARAAAPPRRDTGLASGDDLGTRGWGAPVPLQTGHSAPYDDGVRGGGRGIPLLAGPPSLRPAPGRTDARRRVARVQVLEPGGDGTYGGVCPDGYVYNLEVEGTHTYLVGDGIVAHNCHHAVAPTYLTVLEALGAWNGPTLVAGFTATMDREDNKRLGHVWEEVVFERDILWGIQNGHLVDVKGIGVTVEDFSMREVRSTAGDYNEHDLGEALADSSAPEIIADSYLEHAATEPGLVFAPTVATSRLLADTLTARGISTEHVDGTTPTEERQLAIKRFLAGDVQALSNCGIFTEGTDLPRASVCVVARPTQSNALYVQMVGRVLRPDAASGKRRALVLDIVGAASRNSLVGLTRLTGREVFSDETLLEADERLTAEELAALDEHDTRGRGGEDQTVLEVSASETRDLDLFHGSRQQWLQTPAGWHFLPSGEWLIVIMPSVHGADQFDIGAFRTGPSPRAQYVMQGLEDIGYAHAQAERAAAAVADPARDALWRTRRTTKGQRTYAQSLGVPAGQLKAVLSAGELADLTAISIASARVDPAVQSVLSRH